ncbi:uncharacterized protein LOC101862445 isoform X1 [Aplysia californica]|uniref:Uncharacterized protein LOC101862445 isoform X1 n=1 Tax=Aplysia californica TaxID=6500 RepID=A0ABM0K2F8_APLCA|nr:uncharacterized protein LOC101862445 isoform X1 [Aplysia californica]
MLPGGFKKDSRVWLHKNTHTFQKRAPVADGLNPNPLTGKDDAYYDPGQEESLREPSPLITDASGRVFKKDSRTWLHKSSVRNLAESVTSGAIRIASAAKAARRLRGNTQHPLELCTGDVGVPLRTGLVRTRSSTEMVQNRSNMARQRNKMALTEEQADLGSKTCDVVQRGRRHKGVPYHGIKIVTREGREILPFSTDYCIVQKKAPSRTHQNSSGSDTDMDECDDTDGYCGDETTNEDENDYNGSDRSPERCTRSASGSLSCSPDVVVGFGVGACRAMYTNSAVEVTRDGLRQLERLMQQQLQRRPRDDNQPMDTQSETDVTLEKRFTSPVNSYVSLDACVSLSDECSIESCKPRQGAGSPEVQSTPKVPLLRVLPPESQPASDL